MSSGGGSKSPGKGGKSLELMQKRMQQQQSQQPQSSQQQQPAIHQQGGSVPPQQMSQHPAGGPMAQRPDPTNPPQHQLQQSSASNPVDLTRQVPQMGAGQAHQQQPPGQIQGQPPQARYSQNQASSSKPKGKDFSRMTIQAPRPVPVQTNPLPSPHQQPQAQPKGKDFSAMASRMTPDSRARAVAMQAGAREAAGLPPLNHPTATTVSTNPSAIPSQRYGASQQQQQPPGVTYMRSSSLGGSNPTGAHRRDSHPGPTAAPVVAASTKPTPGPSYKEGTLASPHMAPLVGPRVRELVKSLDPSFAIEASAEKQVLELVDDFLDKVCKQSIRLASHRGSKGMEVQDVQLILAKQWGIVIPGLGPPEQTNKRLSKSGDNKRKASSSPASPPSKVQKTDEQRPGQTM